MRFHQSTPELRHFQKAPLLKLFSKVFIFISVFMHFSVDERQKCIKMYVFKQKCIIVDGALEVATISFSSKNVCGLLSTVQRLMERRSASSTKWPPRPWIPTCTEQGMPRTDDKCFISCRREYRSRRKCSRNGRPTRRRHQPWNKLNQTGMLSYMYTKY